MGLGQAIPWEPVGTCQDIGPGCDDGDERGPGYPLSADWRREWETGGGLSETTITAMVVDRSGILWIGTFESGLDRFAPRHATLRNYGPREGIETADSLGCYLKSQDGEMF